MNIWTAYLTYAWVIALLHGGLLLTCVSLLIAEAVLLAREKSAYEDLTRKKFKSESSNSATEVVRVCNLAFSLAKKGEVPRPEMIRSRLTHSLARHDLVIRTCLNAFVISGLLGTLYNLWKLGPSFWEGLAKGQGQGGQPAIGIAFSASVMGLGLALSLTLIEAFALRHRREKFVREASSKLFDLAAAAFPAKDGAAVAEALNSFYGASEGFLTKLKTEHEELSHQFTRQIRDSSDQLTRTLTNVSDQWVDSTEAATRTIGAVGSKLEVATHGLSQATLRTEETLLAVLPRLEQAESLSVSLLEVRSESNKLQSEITNQLGAFSEQWQRHLEALTKSHIERMETAYTAGWSRYEEEATHWHQQNAAALAKFAESIDNSISKWSADREKVDEQVDALISSWREELRSLEGELGRTTTGIQAGLGGVQEQIESLTTISAQLASSYDSAFQQLTNLRISITGFTANVMNDTPMGKAIHDMTGAISDLKLSIENDGKAPLALDLSHLHGLLERIVGEIRLIPERFPESHLRQATGGASTMGAQDKVDVGVTSEEEEVPLANAPSATWGEKIGQLFKKKGAA